MPHLLIVAYYFPPAGGAAVQRPLKFCRYLPQFGWDVSVLTVTSRRSAPTDRSLLADVPSEVTVYETPHWDLTHREETIRDALARAMRWTGRSTAERISGGLAWRANAWLGQIAFPDRMIAWTIPAVRTARRCMHDRRPDVIWSTAFPYTTHVIAMRLARRWGVPWVADFRDPWLNFLLRRNPTGLRGAMTRWAEGRFVRSARCVTVTTEETADDFRQRYPALAPDRFRSIENGYDPEDFAGIQADATAESDSRLRICYTGALDPSRDLRAFFEALSRVRRRYSDGEPPIEVTLAGEIGSQARYIEQYGVVDCVNALGHINHDRSLALLVNSHVALLPLADLRWGGLVCAGKVYEYLASGAHVLLLAPLDGATGRILGEAGGFTHAPLHDVDRIEAALKDLLDRRRRGEPLARPDAAYVRRYERPALAQRLSALLHEIIGRRADRA